MKTKHIAWAGIGLLTILGHAGAKTVGHEKYTYDASGNIVEKQIDDQVTRFEYEGNLLKADSTGTAYRHDRAGRLTGESLAGQVRRELTYRFGDKVTRVERGGTRTELFYNAEGQLVGRASGKQVETLIWDGLALVGRGGEGFVTEEHPSGGSAVIARGKVVAFDYLGTTLSVGEDVFDSTAFGEGLENGLLTGKPFIEDLESFVFRFRHFLVRGQRWTTADPSGFPDGPNNYGYGLNQPSQYYDKAGLVGEHFMEATDSLNIPCWAQGAEYVGVTSVLKSTFQDSPSVHRSFVYSSSGATGSSPSSNVSLNDPFEESVLGVCPHHGSNFNYKNYKDGSVEGYVQITSPVQIGSLGEQVLTATKIVHDEN